MFFDKLNIKLIKTATALGSLLAIAGCSLINDDLPECPAGLNVRFIYDYNLKFSDAFAAEVTSVYVWAFDESGAFVWSDSASGAILKSPDFHLETPLKEGTYSFVSWCGLKDNGDFNIATYTPTSMEELEVKLKTVVEDTAYVSKSWLKGLYHGKVLNETFTIDPNKPSIKTVTIPLMKDTNDIRILLQRYDGSELGRDDFETFLTIPDAWLAWNNDVLPSGPMVTYLPWNIKYGFIETPNMETSGVDYNISSLLFELSSSRLIENSNAYLTVRRTADNVDIIHIKIIDYILYIRGHYGDISNQEYLDRDDDYSILFFVDKANEWYKAAGIYINKWAVVPPQDESY